MSRRPPFEPVGYALELERSGDYASTDQLLHHWTGTHWSMIDDDTGMRLALRWIADGGHGIVNAANAKVTQQTALYWLPALKAPAKAALIPVQNGYLHLDGCPTLYPHDKKLGLRHVLCCDYDPGAPTPEAFEKLLVRILPDPAVRNRVQEYIGYTLLPDTRHHLAQIWLGSGANGKGTLANIVQALHERKAAASPSKLDGFHAAIVLGASLLYCDEAPQQDWCEQTIKSMIAGELVTVDRKYLPAISTRVSGKWLILANHIPTIRDQSDGFWRRFDIVPFTVSIPAIERDPLLADHIIKHELTGVLNWAVEGLQRLLARNRFGTLPPAMKAALQAARTETNSVHAWVNDEGIDRTVTADTSKSEVYSAYATWCRGNGMGTVASPKFWKRLSDSLGKIVEGREFTKSGRIRTCNVRLY